MVVFHFFAFFPVTTRIPLIAPKLSLQIIAIFFFFYLQTNSRKFIGKSYVDIKVKAAKKSPPFYFNMKKVHGIWLWIKKSLDIS